MIDDFEHGWLDLVRQIEAFEALYVLIGLTRLGDRPTTVGLLAGTLLRREKEATRLAWEAARVRPDEDGRIRLDTPFKGASPRRTLFVGDREMPVSGCAPDLFGVAAVIDVPFRVEDTCSVSGTPIRVGFVPGGVERVEPPEAVAAMLSPEQARQVAEMEVEERNANVCVQQPFFASAGAAREWLDTHPGGRAVPVDTMPHHAWVRHMYDRWRPRILASMA